MAEAHDIFLSYASEDRERVRPIVGALEQNSRPSSIRPSPMPAVLLSCGHTPRWPPVGSVQKRLRANDVRRLSRS